jgi:uncharacterized protein (DUF1810 family)
VDNRVSWMNNIHQVIKSPGSNPTTVSYNASAVKSAKSTKIIFVRFRRKYFCVYTLSKAKILSKIFQIADLRRGRLFLLVKTRVARWFVFKSKLQIWVNF